MSWSVNFTGPKNESTIAEVAKRFETVLALIAGINVEPDKYAPAGYDVSVECHGSHSINYAYGPDGTADSAWLASASFACSVGRKAKPTAD